MNKKQVIEFLSLGNVMLPYEIVLSIYKDDDIIPDGVIDILAQPPMERKIEFYIDAKFEKEWNTAMEGYMRSMGIKVQNPQPIISSTADTP